MLIICTRGGKATVARSITVKPCPCRQSINEISCSVLDQKLSVLSQPRRETFSQRAFITDGQFCLMPSSCGSLPPAQDSPAISLKVVMPYHAEAARGILASSTP
ncbi:hypothetical protein GJAV_G00031330 [Gymnothorax javanicus]|nr:hypothetical protein GJAV_G00031330 [Gymnothorax javanicus]